MPLFKYLQTTVFPWLIEGHQPVVQGREKGGLAGMLDYLTEGAPGAGAGVGGVMSIVGKLVDFIGSIDWESCGPISRS